MMHRCVRTYLRTYLIPTYVLWAKTMRSSSLSLSLSLSLCSSWSVWSMQLVSLMQYLGILYDENVSGVWYPWNLFTLNLKQKFYRVYNLWLYPQSCFSFGRVPVKRWRDTAVWRGDMQTMDVVRRCFTPQDTRAVSVCDLNERARGRREGVRKKLTSSHPLGISRGARKVQYPLNARKGAR